MHDAGFLERLRRSLRHAAETWFARCFHTFVFAALPLLVVIGSNAGVLPLDARVLTRGIALAVAAAALLLVMLRPLVPGLNQRAACVSFVLIGFNAYAFVGGWSGAGAAALYTIATVIAALCIVRPRTSRVRSSTPLNMAACALVAVNVAQSVPRILAPEPWRSAADALIDGVVASQTQPTARPRRDIYYVVLDGFGRPDVLNELYDLDLGPFARALESRGFHVPAAGQSNYAQTFLSLGSSLNLSYLDSVAGSMGRSADRRALHYLIQHNALTRLAKRAGYQVFGIGSNYTATKRFEAADRCFCEQYGLDELEIAAISLTPLRALPLAPWTHEAHRKKIEAAFGHLAEAAREPGPKVVIAHILSPHPPFVYTSDGGPRPSAPVFSFRDGSHFAGSRAEYVAGYREQARFVAQRLLAVVDAVLKQPGPAPVIVLHGDHGPGSMWDWNDVRRGNVRERLAIFSAYHLPDTDRSEVSATMSPVTALRIVANRHLGTTLPPLPDASFASTWARPFEFVRVGAGDGHAAGEGADRIRIAANDSVSVR